MTCSHRAIVRIPIEKLEQMLPASEFMRIHRSVIVRKALIREIHRSPSGAYSAILENGCAPPLSRRRLAAVRAALAGDAGATAAPE